MRKFFISLIVFFCICIFTQTRAFAIDKCTENMCPVQKEVNNDVKGLQKFFDNFSKTQNNHDILNLKKLYSDDYVNTDGYNKNQLFSLVQKTFENYPDMKNEYEILDIKRFSDYAIITVNQKSHATTKVASQITNDNGEYNANLKYTLYLKQETNNWKIYSENTMYEYSTLAYGMAKNVVANLNAPQKVLAGNDYCVRLNIKIPENHTAIASINSTQIVDGFNLQGESFRQVALDRGYLERILKANTQNNNEAVVVSVGFTKQNNDMFKKTKIDLAGMLMLMQRVDIIPVTSNLDTKKGTK